LYKKAAAQIGTANSVLVPIGEIVPLCGLVVHTQHDARSLPGMNPTVEAAWIAAGVGILSLAGTVTVAIIGYRNTRKAALEAARNERLWDKMAAAYEEVLIALLRRQAERTEAATFYRDPRAEEKMRESIACSCSACVGGVCDQRAKVG
jgi:hypothetical protein